MKRLYPAILFFWLCAFLPAAGVSAQEQRLALVTQGKYFSVYGPPDLDINALLAKLNFNYFLRPETAGQKASVDLKDVLSRTIDALYLEVSDILDIRMYASFQGTIRILPDRKAINSQFKKIFRTDFPERSFYIADNNTIYISFADLTAGMLGHEIAHAIICRYFIVPPPTKTQEILAGYVEYTLRKSAGTLP